MDAAKEWADQVDRILANDRKKKLVSLRIDEDIIRWFKEEGPGYQTRINAVLKAYVVNPVFRVKE